MTKISLRAYNQEIENLISHGQTDEAIAHCKYILKLFPKHVDTYRLLGKSYLESQHYTEASDILKRVLSVIPDDFVSQIGLSIIREDEGNLDAAIWHMERSFEVQPSNVAIQDELRRLYGRRDGVEPHKVRLTHGALLRLYLRGELYTQAIAEARAALAEDPQRTDIMVILARCYYLSNREIEAIEVCSRLLSKLPYCFEANRILSEMLPKTAKPEDAKVYQQRMNALDPYYGLISNKTPTISQVPDNAISIERLMWQAADEISKQPTWAQTIGVDLENTEEDIPDWMEAIPSKEDTLQDSTSVPDILDQQSESGDVNIFDAPESKDENIIPQEEDSIPDWMRDAGWEEGSGKFSEEQVSIFSDSTNEEYGESESIEQAEIPDWVQALAPSEENDQDSPEEEKEKLELLDKILPQSKETFIKDSPSAIDNDFQENEDLPEWLNTSIETNLENKNIQKSSQKEEFMPETADQLPDWLSDLQGSGEINEFDSANELPEDFIKSLQDSIEPEEDAEIFVDETQFNSTSTKDHQPIKLDETQQIDSSNETGILDENEKDFPNEDNMLIESSKSDYTPPELSDSINQEALPDWLTNFEEPDSVNADEAEVIPDWLFNSEHPVDTDASTAAPEYDNLPLNLESTDKDFSPTVQDHSLEWIQENDINPTILDDTETNEFTPDQNPKQIGDIEEGLAWLESLAAANGAEEETLVTPQDKRSEDMPDWLKSMEPDNFTDTPSTNDLINAQNQEISPSSTEGTALSDQNWHPEFTQAETEDDLPPFDFNEISPSNAKEKVVEIPDLETNPNLNEKSAEDIDQDILEESFNWLESLAAKQGADEEALVSSKEERTDEIPEWLKTLEPEEETSKTPETQDSLTTPDLESTSLEDDTINELTLPEKLDVEESNQSVSSENNLVEAQLIPESENENQAKEKQKDEFLTEIDDGFAWLESLAAKHGADEETLINPQDDSTLKPPDWIPETEAEISSPEEIVSLDETLSGMLETTSDQDETLAETNVPVQPAKSPSIEDTQPTQLKQTASTDHIPVASSTNEIDSEREIEKEQIPDWLQGIDQIKEEILPGTDESEDFPENDMAEIERLLSKASKALSSNNFNDAFDCYEQAIAINKSPEKIIAALSDALYHFPIEPSLWKFLGDAHAQNHQLKEALDAYTKAEELLR